MKKVLIISDTHGDNTNFRVVLDKVGQPDFFIHCGDIEGTEYYFENVMQCGKIMVMGNNDYFSGLSPFGITNINGLKILVVHGHRYNVNRNNERLVELGRINDVNVVLYGHSHKPKIEQDSATGIWTVNPGSLTYPRQEGRRPSYAMLEVTDDGVPSFNICYL